MEPELFRPTRLSDFIGQCQVIENLKVYIKAALLRREVLDHVLLIGPDGFGKATLANIIANEMGADIRTTTGHSIEKSGDLTALLTNLQEGDVLFIDEIDRLPPAIRELIYPATTNFHMEILIGQGTAARLVNLELPKFTLVGATTKIYKVNSLLRESFGISFHLTLYSDNELAQIILKSADLVKLELDEAAAYLIARRAQGLPATANPLLKRVRDYAEVMYDGCITEQIAEEILKRLTLEG